MVELSGEGFLREGRKRGLHGGHVALEQTVCGGKRRELIGVGYKVYVERFFVQVEATTACVHLRERILVVPFVHGSYTGFMGLGRSTGWTVRTLCCRACGICLVVESPKPLNLRVLSHVACGPGSFGTHKVFVHVVDVFVGPHFGCDIVFIFDVGPMARLWFVRAVVRAFVEGRRGFCDIVGNLGQKSEGVCRRLEAVYIHRQVHHQSSPVRAAKLQGGVLSEAGSNPGFFRWR